MRSKRSTASLHRQVGKFDADSLIRVGSCDTRRFSRAGGRWQRSPASSHSQSGGSPMWVPVQWRGWCNHRCWRLSMLRKDYMPGQCRQLAASTVSPLAERRWIGGGGRKLVGPFGLSTAASGAQAGDLLRVLSTLSTARRKRTLVVARAARGAPCCRAFVCPRCARPAGCTRRGLASLLRAASLNHGHQRVELGVHLPHPREGHSTAASEARPRVATGRSHRPFPLRPFPLRPFPLRPIPT